MEVILLKHVQKLGSIGETVNVATGYAKNYLIPNEVAIAATRQNKSSFEEMRKEIEAKDKKSKQEAQTIAKKISNLELTIISLCGEDGRLYGSISKKTIASEVNKQCKTSIKHTDVKLDSYIRSIGVHLAEINLHSQVQEKILINVARSESEILENMKKYRESEESQQKKD